MDIITGGSPCQDLSVAGKRAGLDGERSGLFMEQIRIVKEMRERDRRTGRTGWLIRPRFMVWENVPGAFSSNKGKDFQAVLTEIVKIVEPDAPNVPLPDKGKWSHSGCLYDELGRWSVAWRLHDAQFWGVPQRRKRIALVADFGGLAAPEILFEREGLSGDFEPGETEGEGTAGGAESGVGESSFCLTGWDCQSKRIFEPEGICATLNSGNKEGGNITPSVIQRKLVIPIEGNGVRESHRGCGYGKPGGGKRILIQNERVGALSTLNNQSVCYGISSYASNAMLSDNPHSGIYEADTARTLDLNGGSPACNQGGIAVVQSGSVMGVSEDATGAHPAEERGHQPIVYENHSQDSRYKPLGEVSETVNAKYGTGGNNQPLVVEPTIYNGENVTSPQNKANPQPGDPCHTLGTDTRNYVTSLNHIVRRLTPLECERLQGYPDGWTDIGEWIDSKGKKHKEADSPRYKALGNSIALPFWAWLARRICAMYERPMTLGSLFDGIGGFPLVFERAGAKAVWASEIEEFCVAVTKKHFQEEVTNERSFERNDLRRADH